MVMIGNFNGRTGCQKGYKVVGPYSESTLCGNRHRLIELCEIKK